MNILCLDLGTKCGYAFFIDGKIKSGVWNLQPSKFDSSGQRFIDFTKMLDQMLFDGIDRVYYEEVRQHRAIDAAHIYGAFMGLLQAFCLLNSIPYQGIPVQTIKKSAAGSGNAKKEQMVTAAIKLYPSINILDDNHADALCLLHHVKKNLHTN